MKTKQEIVGFIFGANLSSFDDIGDPLSEEHVIRHWMFCADRKIKEAGNGDPAKVGKLGVKVNNEIITEVSNAVISFFREKSVAIVSDLEVFSKVKDLVTTRIMSYIKSPNKEDITEQWKKGHLAKFQNAFDIKKSEKVKRKIFPTDRLIEGDTTNSGPSHSKKIKLDNDATFDPNLVESNDSSEEDDDDLPENWEDEEDETESNYCTHDFEEAVLFGMRHYLSDRKIAGMINKTLKCLPEYKDDVKMRVTHTKVRATRIRLKRKMKEELMKKRHKRWLMIDGRKDMVRLKNNKYKRVDNVTIFDGTSDPAEYVDHTQPEDGSSVALATEIYRVVKNTESEECLDGVTIDGCSVNVGGGETREGAIYFLEHHFLKRNLQYSVGMFHLNELTLRHLLQKCFQFVTSGPYDFIDPIGKKVKRLQNNLKPNLNYDAVKTDVPLDIPETLIPKGSDHEYAYKICWLIDKGRLDEKYFWDESFVNRNPGNIGHARWLNTWNNIARMYCQMTEPQRGQVNEMGLTWEQFMFVKRIVILGSQVYIPNHFMIKMNSDISQGPANFLEMIHRALVVCSEREFIVFKDVMLYNCFYAHPEAILYAAVTRGDTELKNKAVDVIENIRKTRRDDELRKYILPQEFINLDAQHFYELLDFGNLPKEYLTVPPLFRKISTSDLRKFANNEIVLEFLRIKNHNVDIERGVKATTEAAAKAGTHDEQQAFILAAAKSRREVPLDSKKSLY